MFNLLQCPVVDSFVTFVDPLLRARTRLKNTLYSLSSPSFPWKPLLPMSMSSSPVFIFVPVEAVASHVHVFVSCPHRPEPTVMPCLRWSSSSATSQSSGATLQEMTSSLLHHHHHHVVEQNLKKSNILSHITTENLLYKFWISKGGNVTQLDNSVTIYYLPC